MAVDRTDGDSVVGAGTVYACSLLRVSRLWELFWQVVEGLAYGQDPMGKAGFQIGCGFRGISKENGDGIHFPLQGDGCCAAQDQSGNHDGGQKPYVFEMKKRARFTVVDASGCLAGVMSRGRKLPESHRNRIMIAIFVSGSRSRNGLSGKSRRNGICQGLHLVGLHICFELP